MVNDGYDPAAAAHESTHVSGGADELDSALALAAIPRPLGKVGATGELIALSFLTLPPRASQTIPASTFTFLDWNDTTTDISFYFNELPTAPTGLTVKGRLYGIGYSACGNPNATIQLYNNTDSVEVTNFVIGNAESTHTQLSGSFTIPPNTKEMKIRIWIGGVGCSLNIWSLGIIFVGVM